MASLDTAVQGKGHAIDTRRPGEGFHPRREINSLKRETLCAACAYQILWRARMNYPRELPIADALSGMLIGAAVGYLIARHSAEIEWVLRALIG
jgi:hypothetical protein